jgi:hypothetical protein
MDPVAGDKRYASEPQFQPAQSKSRGLTAVALPQPEPEPEVSWNLQPTAISWICEFVSIYDDSMPADLWQRLKQAMHLPEH